MAAPPSASAAVAFRSNPLPIPIALGGTPTTATPTPPPLGDIWAPLCGSWADEDGPLFETDDAEDEMNDSDEMEDRLKNDKPTAMLSGRGVAAAGVSAGTKTTSGRFLGRKLSMDLGWSRRKAGAQSNLRLRIGDRQPSSDVVGGDDGGDLLASEPSSPVASSCASPPQSPMTVAEDSYHMRKKSPDSSKIRQMDENHYIPEPGDTLGTYKVRKCIGVGTYGVVVVGQHQETGESVAIKVTSDDDPEWATLQSLGRKVSRHNIVDLHDTFVVHRQGHDYRCLVFELMECDLDEFLDGSGSLTLDGVRVFGYHLLKALCYLRDRDIAHADLKSSNVMLSRRGLRLIDFGFANYTDEVLEECQSVPYRCPEVFMQRQPYTCAIDMWSLGCILTELYTQTVIYSWPDFRRWLRRIVDGDSFEEMEEPHPREYIRKWISSFVASRPCTSAMNEETEHERAQFVGVVSKMLEADPARRISPREALRHPFFNPKEFLKRYRQRPLCVEDLWVHGREAAPVAPFGPAGQRALHFDTADRSGDSSFDDEAIISHRTRVRVLQALLQQMVSEIANMDDD